MSERASHWGNPNCRCDEPRPCNCVERVQDVPEVARALRALEHICALLPPSKRGPSDSALSVWVYEAHVALKEIERASLEAKVVGSGKRLLTSGRIQRPKPTK